MDTLSIEAKKANGTPLTDAQAQAALDLVRSKLAPDPQANVTSWGLSGATFHAEAEISVGLTEPQFRNFVDDLLPDGVSGSVSVHNALGEMLYEAAIPAASGQDIQGRTNPAPTPIPTTWTTPKV